MWLYIPPTPVSLFSRVVEVLGYSGSVIVFLTGLSTYRRTELWKRADAQNAEKWKQAEFAANQMKEFFANPRVQRALILIDWDAAR
jgi:uncharacterized protein YaeQ